MLTELKSFNTIGILTLPNKDEASVDEIVDHLESTYCGQLSVELCHIEVSAKLSFRFSYNYPQTS